MAPPWTLALLFLAVVALSAANQCPEVCTCKTTRRGALTADCSFSSLKDVPKRFPTQPAILDLSGNTIPTLRTNMFAGKGLVRTREIILRESQVTEIKPNAFKGMKGLRKLDLSFNNLQKLEINMFPPGLRSLDVRGNNDLDCHSLKKKFAVKGTKLRFFCSRQTRRSLKKTV